MHTTKWSWIGGNYIAARQLKAWSTYMRHVWGARMKQWWKHTPPTHVARVQLPESTPYSMWVKFVVDSLPCSERFLSRYSNFPLSSKPNTSKFQFDLERKDTLNSYVLQFGFNFFFFRSSPKINRMLYAYHKTHLHTTKVVMILIPSSQGLHYIGTPETMPDIACYISSVTSVNLKKAGMARRNIVIKKQYTLLWISFPVVFGLLISGRPTKKNACIFKVSLC